MKKEIGELFDGLTVSAIEDAAHAYAAGVDHDFQESTQYDVVIHGKRYPPKAIVGLAASAKSNTRIEPADFSGGLKSKCHAVLERLGFSIVPKEEAGAGADLAPPETVAWVLQGNPEFYDIDQYLSRQNYIYWNWPKLAEQAHVGMPVLFKRSGPENGIVALGKIAELPKLPPQVEHPELLGTDLWKQQPSEAAVAKVGVQLTDVRLSLETGMLPWEELKQIKSLANHPLIKARLGTVFKLNAQQAFDLTQALNAEAPTFSGGIAAALEGRRQEMRHFRIERNQGLVRAKKLQFQQEHGYLHCEVCGFRYDQHYPADLAEGFIEAHHIRPLADIEEARITTFEDLILVCANCHRMVHRSRDVVPNLDRLRTHFGKGN